MFLQGLLFAVRWLCFFAVSSAWASMPAVTIENQPVLSLKNRMEALEDSTRALEIHDVIEHADEFKTVDVYPALGFTRSAYWFRIPLSRPETAPQHWVLKLNPTYLDHVTVWVEQAGQIVQEKNLGRRDYENAGYILRDPMQTALELPLGNSWLYIRVKTVTTLTIIPALMQPDTFIQRNDKTTFKVGILAGIMLIVFVFNMVCWWLTRVNMYGIFGGYVGFGLLSILEGLDMLTSYFMSEWPFENIRPLSVFLGFSWLFGFMFFRILLVDKHQDWWIYRIYQALYLCAAVAILSGLLGGYSYSYVAEVLCPVTLIVLLVTLVPAFRMIFSGGSLAIKLQGIAYLPLAFYLSSNQLLIAGWMTPSMLNILGQTQGGMLQIVLLQVALLYRVRDLMKERNQAVDEAARVNEEVGRERAIREEQSRFLSMLTHEIRTPLAVIDLAVQSMRVLDDDPDTFRETRYSRIQSGVKRMSTLLELGLQKDDFSNEAWEPNDVVNLVDISRTAIAELPVDLVPRIEFTVHSDDVTVKGNGAALKLTFFNLVENALKYSGKNDRIHVSVGEAAGDVYWQVDDSGDGIPEEQRRSIFEKFYRAAEVSGKPGLGLGLYIANQVIKRHSGYIECLESSIGGACFRCSFPKGAL